MHCIQLTLPTHTHTIPRVAHCPCQGDTLCLAAVQPPLLECTNRNTPLVCFSMLSVCFFVCLECLCVVCECELCVSVRVVYECVCDCMW